MMTWDTFAKYIKKRRVFMNKTISETASELAINRYKYFRIENGLQEPNFIELQKIFEYFEIELNIIIHK